MKTSENLEFTFTGPELLFYFVHELIICSYYLQGCSRTLNETFGQIELTTTSYHDIRCNWKIHSAGINEAVAFISVQELDLYYCR